ncbi:MAG TPA: hypothetical protein PLI09_03500 [Candidatus Hydrogenedentes bacterium]|nr:hypothetical protein [Candidatus Hydrogenedentota bacterium]
MTMPNVVQRVTNYLHRQIAWLEQVLGELEQFERALDAPELDVLAARQRAREQELRHFVREQRGLQQEWEQAKNVSEEDRAEVKTLSERSRQLTEQLARRFETAIAQLDTAKNKRIKSAQALQRGRGMLDKYRPGGDLDPGFIDRRA